MAINSIPQVYFNVQDISPLRCPVCGGTESTINKLYPNNRYCIECGISMNTFNFSVFKNVFRAMSTLSLAREYLIHGWDLRTIYSSNTQIKAKLEAKKLGQTINLTAPETEPIEVVLLRLMSNVLNAYNYFRGADHLINKDDYVTAFSTKFKKEVN